MRKSARTTFMQVFLHTDDFHLHFRLGNDIGVAQKLHFIPPRRGVMMILILGQRLYYYVRFTISNIVEKES